MRSRLIPKHPLRVILMTLVFLFVGRSTMWSASACPVITNSPADAGSYSVVVSNATGTATSASATLTVNTAVSASSLTNLVRSVGANAVVNATALGNGPFRYVWDKGGTVLAGQTNSSLILTNLALSDSGVYRVAGAQFEDFGQYRQNLNGRQVTLDLSNSIFVTVGVSYSF